MAQPCAVALVGANEKVLSGIGREFIVSNSVEDGCRGMKMLPCPRQMSEWAAGFDLHAAVADPYVLHPARER